MLCVCQPLCVGIDCLRSVMLRCCEAIAFTFKSQWPTAAAAFFHHLRRYMRCKFGFFFIFEFCQCARLRSHDNYYLLLFIDNKGSTEFQEDKEKHFRIWHTHRDRKSHSVTVPPSKRSKWVHAWIELANFMQMEKNARHCGARASGPSVFRRVINIKS